MKTLIELYDERPLENILATEVFRPERTMLLAPPEVAQNEALLTGLRAFLQGRGIATQLTIADVDMHDPYAVTQALADTEARYPDCALDIAGGTDAALFAGGLYAGGSALPVFTYSRKKKRFFNIRSAPFAEVDASFVRFSVADFLRMAGGSLRQGRVDNALLARYMGLFEPFFAVFLAHRKSWVHTINWMQAVSQGDKENLVVRAPRQVKAARTRVSPDEETLRGLAELGMLQGLAFEGEEIAFSFADKQIRTWLRDIGSVLELYVTKLCLDVGLFSDVVSSVVVDWAGRQEADGVTNEIDVMASRGLTPLFISCKTGEVKTEAINELAILRDRFGGAMAHALIVTAENAGAATRNRAAELSIRIADLADLEAGKLGDRLEETVRA